MNHPYPYPMAFRPPLVRALLNTDSNGNPINNQLPFKTQTRRVMKPRPLVHNNKVALWKREFEWILDEVPDYVIKACPRAGVGDRIWVKETMRVIWCDLSKHQIQVKYMADGTDSTILPFPERLKCRPVVGKCLPRGGYREVSRLLLDVVSVGVERIQDITPNDAIQEGIDIKVTESGIVYRDYSKKDFWVTDPIQSFRTLWDSINQDLGFGWDTNCVIWKRVLKKCQSPF